MSQLIESIKIYNGRVYNIQQHDLRCNASRYELFGIEKPIRLRENIRVPPSCRSGLFKCRVVYDYEIQTIEFIPYMVRKVDKVAVVVDDEIEYPHKFLARPELDVLRFSASEADEILIVKNGLLTDAYYYNIVLEIEGRLLTPKMPLLKGVMRSKLLHYKRIKECRLTLTDLENARRILLINALTNLGQIIVYPEQILNFKK